MSKILLSEDKLHYILERHDKEIGRRANWSSVVTGSTFIISTMGASYDNFFFLTGSAIKTAIIVVAVMLTIWGVLMELNNHNKKFDKNVLYEEMVANNEMEHPFSIVAIKDTFREFPNKYLLYYDNRWNCWFFFNFKTVENAEQNEASIKKGIATKLKINTDKISLIFKVEDIHRKYSVSDDVIKYYHHSLYDCVIDEFRDEIEKDDFSIDGIKYKWMTIDEMEKNPSIKKHNLDVVEFVKSND